MSLEQRVRSTLEDAGSRIDTTAELTRRPFTSASRSRRRLRLMLAFGASFAAALLFGAVAVLVSGDGAGPAGNPQPRFSGLLGSVVGQLPNGFDPEQAAPLLTNEGNPEEIATQYLESRLSFIDVGVSGVEEQGGYTLVHWAWGRLLNPNDSQSERGERGWLLLRPILRGYEVVAATTDGVDLSDLTLSEGAVTGAVASDSGEFIGADVLSLGGSPVESAPHPDGFFPDADFLWGTAGASNPPLTLDIPVSEPVIIRINRVGGTLLSVSEVILGSPAPEDVDRTQSSGPPLTDQQFEEVFSNEDSGVVIRDSAFLAHSRDQDGLGVFSLYGAKANSAGGIEFDQPVNCIYEHGMDGGVGGIVCGPDVSLDTPGITLTSSCVDPDVTMFSAWAINPEVELYELVFSDGSNARLEPDRGYVIWAWRNTKHLVDIRADNASPEVQRAVDDHANALADPPCD